MFYLKIILNLLIIVFFLSPLPDKIISNYVYPWFNSRFKNIKTEESSEK